MIINKSGITIRLKVADVRIMGRATQGVRLINLEKRNDEIGSVCKVTSESEETNVAETLEGENIEENRIANNGDLFENGLQEEQNDNEPTTDENEE